MCYGNQTWSEESLMWVCNDDDLHGGQRSSEVKCGKLCAMATKLGQKNPWCKFMMMMTFMEVKGHHRSNAETMCYGIQTWSEESLMWVYNDDDLHGGQRSSEVKCGKLCAMATKLGQKNPWCKFMMMMTFMKVKGHQRLNVVNIALWLPNLVRKNPWCKFMTVMTFMKVRGHQRSNVVNFALWLPNLVNRIANASFK